MILIKIINKNLIKKKNDKYTIIHNPIPIIPPALNFLKNTSKFPTHSKRRQFLYTNYQNPLKYTEYKSSNTHPKRTKLQRHKLKWIISFLYL